MSRLPGGTALLRDLALCVILPALLGFPAGSTRASEAGVATAGPGAIALRTVAEALGTAPEGGRVISTEARDFPDASLGCPQPGMAYAQVITPGYVVLVEVDGRRFDIRVAGDRGRICYRRKPAPAGGSVDLPAPRESGEAARQDLALRLGIPANTVTVTALRHLKAGETVPGCGTPCASDAAAGSCGVGVRLRADGRVYDYVALPGGVRPCPDIAWR